MFGGAAAFLVIAIVAAVTGHSAIAGTSLTIAWILFLFGLIFAAIFFLAEQRPRQGSGS
ncbi:MAG TPA: DUF1328 domain-containing protein [Woeseiaceae bacterium]|jgi:uncharacterized membrane protein YtjA (UPF0391 family)